MKIAQTDEQTNEIRKQFQGPQTVLNVIMSDQGGYLGGNQNDNFFLTDLENGSRQTQSNREGHHEASNVTSVEPEGTMLTSAVLDTLPAEKKIDTPNTHFQKSKNSP